MLNRFQFPISIASRRLAVSCGAIFVATSSQAFVVNGSFQEGSEFAATGWTQFFNGIAATDDYYRSGSAAFGSTPYGGRFILFNSANSAAVSHVKQTIATTIGQQYRLTFSYGAALADTDQRLTVRIDAAEYLFTDSTGTYDLSQVFQNQSVSFVATNTATEIFFADYGSSGQDGDLLLDNVSVQAVPEPTTMAALGIGLLSIRRKRKQK